MNNAAEQQTPSRVRRFACMMYEGILLFGVVFFAGYLFDTLTQSTHALMLRSVRQGWLFLAIGAYFVLCWGHKGQTLPMKTWNIRLLDRHGMTPSWPRLILRYMLAWPLVLVGASLVTVLAQTIGWQSLNLLIVAAPFTIFIWSWFDPDGQFLHDRILGTPFTQRKIIISQPKCFFTKRARSRCGPLNHPCHIQHTYQPLSLRRGCSSGPSPSCLQLEQVAVSRANIFLIITTVLTI